MLVFSLKASSFSGSFDRSVVIGPVWRQESEKFEGSSFSPSGWPQPPLRAWEMWQMTPGTRGSSKSLTQTLSLGDSRLKVVLTQARSSAWLRAVSPTSIANTPRTSTPAPNNSRFITDLYRYGRPRRRQAHRWAQVAAGATALVLPLPRLVTGEDRGEGGITEHCIAPSPYPLPHEGRGRGKCGKWSCVAKRGGASGRGRD